MQIVNEASKQVEPNKASILCQGSFPADAQKFLARTSIFQWIVGVDGCPVSGTEPEELLNTLVLPSWELSTWSPTLEIILRRLINTIQPRWILR